MKRLIVRILLSVVAVGVAMVVVVAIAMRAPAPLKVAQQHIVLSNVTVINPAHDRHSAQTVKIDNGRITAIASHSEADDNSSARSYAGAYVLPGLIDMHVHHPPARMDPGALRQVELLYLDYGVTSVRDAGSFDGSILPTRQQILRGEFAGPRIFACGPIFDGDPPVWPGSKVVHNASEAERGVDEVAAQGVHCIKAYERLTPDALEGLRRAAARHHLPLIGHVPRSVPFEQAHLDDVQHLTGAPAMTQQKFASPLEAINATIQAWNDIDDARINFIVRTSVEQKIAHTPTIVVVDQLTNLSDPALQYDPGALLLPRYYREIIWKPAALPNPKDSGAPIPPRPYTALENFREVVRRMHGAGVVLHVGTDTLNPFVVPGEALHKELGNFVECGFTPEQAWAAATRENGAALPEPGLGTVAVGAPADLLVYREDPTRDLDAASSLEAVIANGRIYTKEDLDAAVARNRDHFRSWLYDHLTMLAARAMAVFHR
jgi:hypothetical protein